MRSAVCVCVCAQMDIQGQIRDVLAKALRAEGDRAVSDQELLSELQRRGIVEDTMKQLTFTNTVRVLFSAQVSLVMFQTGSPVVDETSLPQDHSSLKRLVVSSGAHGSYNPGFWRTPCPAQVNAVSAFLSHPL